ncbi:MAG: hypothetical protein LBT16_09935 [Treponema sp.]|jgi:hypothetical protein|nr:hypothetical protein [Treponema sp.]
MKRTIIISATFALMFLWVTPLFPLSLEELIGSERAAELLEKGAISGMEQKNPRLFLVPRHLPLQNIISKTFQELEPGVVVETLFLYKKPAGAEPAAWSGDERTTLFNQLLALSTLTGIEYFSSSRGRMRIFYETSVVIDDPDTKNPQPDPHYTSPPEELRLYTRQKDLTFGDNIYQYYYYAEPDAFVFIQKNLSSMKYGPVRVIDKEKLRSVVAVLDAGDYLLVYTTSMAQAVSIPGMGRRVQDSFLNRAKAIFGWFSRQADKTFGT